FSGGMVMNKEIRRLSNFSSLPVLIFVLFMQLSASAIQIGVSLLERFAHIALPEQLVYMIMYIFVYPIGGSLAALIFYKTRKRETGLRLSQAFCRPQMNAGWIIKYMIITWGLSLLMSMVTNIILQILKSLLHLNFTDISFDFGDGIGGFIVSFVSLSIFAPIFEEIIFRSAVYRHTEIMGQSFAVVFSAIVFALMHGNLEQLPYTFVMGLGFAYLFAKTRSLLIPMLLHFLTNTTTVIFTSIIGTTDTDELSTLLSNRDFAAVIPTVLYSLVIYGIIIAAIVLGIIELVRAIRRRERLMGSIFPISGAKKTAVFLTAPVTIITLILLVLFLTLTTINQLILK
ncbi:MAG: CPBP family intramembrane metalloprotease, partial [Ruminococcus sp.]|nr:CPBP family intramembrane metalloprotease [Ruminococcus sp.]